MGRIFEPAIMVALFGAAGMSAALGYIVGTKYDSSTRSTRAMEAALTAFFGGFIAHGFISVMLSLGNDSESAGLLTGWAFFGVHGLVDTVLAIIGEPALMTTSGPLLTTAAIVGVVHGALHGTYRTYRWLGFGPLQFAADMTWGLLGSTTGALVHVYNCAFGERAIAPSVADGPVGQRLGAAVFWKGFHPPRSSAFTQGAVVSNFGESGDAPLLRHELTHVLQNRVFGPFYTLTYLAWMTLMIVPSLIADVVKKVDPDVSLNESRVMAWCYFSNPWEVWAYAVHSHHAGSATDIRKSFSPTSWPVGRVMLFALFFLAIGTAAIAGLTLT